METGYLIVGLGNPGGEYAVTRHNAGFLLVQQLAERWRASWTDEKKFRARIGKIQRENKPVFLCQPQTFMNLSGEAVKAVSDYFRIGVANLMVAVDDADLPLGAIRMRSGGSSGGHHGLESIQQHLGTGDFARLRIGIGRSGAATREITGYVLGTFEAAERPLLAKVLERAGDQVETWLRDGVARAMNEFNGAVTLPENTKDTK